LSIEITLFGTVTLASWFPLNADSPMVSTLLPMVALASWLLANADSPMLFTLLGMVTLARLQELLKALYQMLVMLPGMVNEGSVFPAGYTNKTVLSLLYSTPLSEQYLVFAEAILIAVRL